MLGLPRLTRRRSPSVAKGRFPSFPRETLYPLLVLFGVQGCSDDKALEPENSGVHSTGGDASASGSGGTTAPSGAGGTGEPGGSTSVGGQSPFATEVSIQEEELGFCSVDGVIEETNAGFSGSGYANSDNVLGASIAWSIQIGTDGLYEFEATFANGSAAERSADLIVDGKTVSAVSFPTTTDWATWSSASAEVSLTAGAHSVTISAKGAEGLANIDSLTVSGAAVGAVDCSATSGTGGSDGTGGAGSASGGTGGSSPLADITVYVAGDSTVSTYADTPSSGDQAGWGQMLHEIFDERVTVVNRAVGGRTARWFHLEGGTEWILDRIQPGDYWFVQFGTNDSHPTATFEVGGVVYPRLAVADGAFKEHLKNYYLDPARAMGAIPVLVTPPPRNSAYCGKGNSLGGYAQAMRELAAAEQVTLLDNNRRTFDHLEAICPSPTPEDFFFVRANSSVDGTHFQENGARHMARFLGDEMIAKSAGPYLYLIP